MGRLGSRQARATVIFGAALVLAGVALFTWLRPEPPLYQRSTAGPWPARGALAADQTFTDDAARALTGWSARPPDAERGIAPGSAQLIWAGPLPGQGAPDAAVFFGLDAGPANPDGTRDHVMVTVARVAGGDWAVTPLPLRTTTVVDAPLLPLPSDGAPGRPEAFLVADGVAEVQRLAAGGEGEPPARERAMPRDGLVTWPAVPREAPDPCAPPVYRVAGGVNTLDGVAFVGPWGYEPVAPSQVTRGGGRLLPRDVAEEALVAVGAALRGDGCGVGSPGTVDLARSGAFTGMFSTSPGEVSLGDRGKGRLLLLGFEEGVAAAWVPSGGGAATVSEVRPERGHTLPGGEDVTEAWKRENGLGFWENGFVLAAPERSPVLAVFGNGGPIRVEPALRRLGRGEAVEVYAVDGGRHDVTVLDAGGEVSDRFTVDGPRVLP